MDDDQAASADRRPSPNRTLKSVYAMMWLDTKHGPLVLETPPNVLGVIDDHWFQYVSDFGRVGPDKGKGGKFLLLPPGYVGAVPQGYFVLRSKTYGNLVFWRGFIENGSTTNASPYAIN